MDRLAGLFGGGRPEVPVGAAQASLPIPSTGTTGVAAPPATVPSIASEEPKTDPAAVEKPKKRGFWSRVFGRGPDKKSENKKKEDNRY
jgi:hypothetical protein